MRPARHALLIAAIVAVLAGMASGPPALAQEPNFTNVTDILGGRRTLFPMDDLLVSWPLGQSHVLRAALFTNEGSATSVYSDQLAAASVVSGIGRMFDLPYDVAVTLLPGSVAVTAGPGTPLTTKQFPLTIPGTPNTVQFAKGDFTGDGFADFAFIVGSNVYVITAQDVGNMDAGVFLSDPGSAPFSLTGWSVLAAGDFDGDGTDEVALAASPAASSSISIAIYDVEVTTQGGQRRIQLLPKYSLSFTAPAAITTIVATAGNFGGVGNASTTNPTTGISQDQLLLVYKYDDHGDQIIAQLFGLNDQGQLQAVGSSTTVRSGGSVNLSRVASGYLAFPGTSEQAVVSFQGTDEGHLSILTADANLNVSVSSETTLPGPDSSFIYGVAVGNFGFTTQTLTTLQVAVFTCDGFGFGVPSVHLYAVSTSVDPGTGQTVYSLNKMSQAPVGESLICEQGGFAGIAAGDLQGRSLLLGPPTIVRVQHTQPHIILGMPPAHVDWVIPANEASQEVLNLSAVFGGFFSSFQTAVTNQDQSSRQSTTSYTQSIFVSSTAGYQWGSAQTTGSVSVSVTASLGNVWEGSVTHAYGNYQGTAFDASSQTGFDDEVWFIDQRHNVYVYPVIGHTACPADNPSCTDPQPLHVMFSGPDQVSQTRAAGASLEWYQPVQEPGNVLSYPWSLSRLQAQYQDPSMNLLTSGTPTTFYTDSSSLVEEAQWQAGESQSVTSGSGTNTSWGTSVSISQKPGIEGGAIGNLTFSYNGSVSLSTLNTSKTTVGSSTGVGITKPGTFPDPGEYQYAIQPFIFGTQPPAGTNQPVSELFGTSVPPVETSGILQAAFTADPTDPNAGAWWQGAYPQPDLALNHPVRWSVTTETASLPPPNCIRIAATALTVNCATFNEPQPDVWTSEFHWMKGLLITPASANGQGPQLAQATAGDQLLLQARVYNYSLTDMPAGTEAVVRFYGQPWDPSQNAVASAAFLIDEVTLGPIPGFNSASNGGTQPNWALASTTTLDTASYSDQYLVFWVIVWIQDVDGRLVAEMPGHGLKAIPGALTDITEATPLLESHSNNIGFYKYAFYIAPPSSGLPLAARRAGGAGDRLPLAVEAMSMSPAIAVLNQQVQVSARLRAGTAPLDGVSVYFFDGQENADRPFDVESISHIRAGSEYEVRVPFRSTTCGTHTLVVETHPQRATNQATIVVTVDAPAALAQLRAATQQLDVRSPRRELLELVGAAEAAVKRGEVGEAVEQLRRFHALARRTPGEQVTAAVARADLIAACLRP